MSRLIDERARREAPSTFDKNVVVTAGAGTGKTTLLIARIVNLLIEREIDISRILALTFTDKAANEIKVRLKERLEDAIEEAGKGGGNWGKSGEKVAELARSALAGIERAQIGTIHSFTAHLLRMFPLESGYDSDVIVDEGEQFDLQFRNEWNIRLNSELAADSPHREEWKKILSSVTLSEIGDVVRELCAGGAPIERFSEMKGYDERYVAKVADDIARHAALCSDGGNVLLRQLTNVGSWIAGGRRGEPDLIQKTISKAKKGWRSERDMEAAHDFLNQVRARIDSLRPERGEIIDAALAVSLPFARQFRDKFAQRGYISFDGLLSSARDLIRENAGVRERVKSAIDSILIDEFQDTDPVQSELLLFISEEQKSRASRWEDVKLEKGKLFIVADPKQSIYGFRGADIESYEKVREMVIGQGGVEYHLQTNFRSHSGIVESVNALFGKIIVKNMTIQPKYIPIAAREGRDPYLPSQRVELILCCGRKDGILAGRARETEAKEIGDWIGSSVGTMTILDREGRERPLQYRDIAILFRTLSPIYSYVESLRSAGIPYLIEGEKFFYNTPEIVDIANLLSALADPGDLLSLCGALRSPIFALTDDEIYRLKSAGLLGRNGGEQPLAGLIGGERARSVEAVFALLRELRKSAETKSVDELVDDIFTKCALMETASVQYCGEQAVANLEKIGDLVKRMAQSPDATIRTIVRLLRRYMREGKEEGESPLSDESLDAVRVFSMHKSKGLEFPVVILPNLHGLPHGGRDDRPVRYEWATGTIGVSLGKLKSLSWHILEAKEREKEQEEEKRLLYVALTRARERLIMTSGWRKGRKGAHIDHLLIGMGDEERRREEPPPCVPSAPNIAVRHVVADDEATLRRAGTPARPAGLAEEHGDWSEVVERWRTRDERYESVYSTEFFVSPSSLKREMKSEKLPLRVAGKGGCDPALVGTICHEFLSRWDFRDDGKMALLESAAKTVVEKKSEVKPYCLDAAKIMEGFWESDSCREIRKSDILGREIPFIFRNEGQIVEGIIDIVYKIGGEFVVADYKSDNITMEALPARVEEYRMQRELYVEAARRALRVSKPKFRFIFLRLGRSVDYFEGLSK